MVFICELVLNNPYSIYRVWVAEVVVDELVSINSISYSRFTTGY